MSKLIVSPRPTLSKLNTIDGIAPDETAKVRLHNGPRYEEIRIKANYNIAASIRFLLTADEIFNAKQRYRDSSAFSVR